MNIKDILAKIASGETLTDDEKTFVGQYDPQKELDTASAAARRKAEAARKDAEDKLAAANATLAELQEKVESQGAGQNAELAKLQKQVAKLTAANEKLEATNKANARKEAITAAAKANGVLAAEGISQAAFDRLLDLAVGDTDVTDTDAIKGVLDSFKADNPAMIAASVKGGIGTKGIPAGSPFAGVANPWKAESFNLTKQIEISTQNPQLATTMKAEAGVSTPQS